MKLQTCSATISFCKNLEDESAKFYLNVAQRYAEGKDIFLSFVKENEKNVVQIQRTYYGVISDAIEGCFAFNINPDDYVLKTEVAAGASYAETLKQAVEMEEKVIKFYTDAAEQSKSLMADIPRAFLMVAKKRGNRVTKLKSL